MVPLVELGLETLALIHQEVVGLALGGGEGRCEARLAPLSVLDPWVVVPLFGGLPRTPHMCWPHQGRGGT